MNATSACPQCGTPPGQSDKFCNSCGAPLNRPAAAAPQQAAPPAQAYVQQPGQPGAYTPQPMQYVPPGGQPQGLGQAPGQGQGGYGQQPQQPPPQQAYGAGAPQSPYGAPSPQRPVRCQMGHEIAPGASYCAQGHPIALDAMQFAGGDPYGGQQQQQQQQQQPQGYGAPQQQQQPYGQPPQGFGAPQQQQQQQVSPTGGMAGFGGYGQPQQPPQAYAPPAQGYGAPSPQPGFGNPAQAPAPQQSAFQPAAAPPPAYAPPPAIAPSPGPGASPPNAETTPERAAIGPNGLRGFLVAYQANPQGDYWPLKGGRVTIGRANAPEPPDVPLADATISSRHAILHVDAVAGTVQVEDTNSTNGTYVNEEHIGMNGKRDLKDGDRVRFGGFTTVVKIVGRLV